MPGVDEEHDLAAVIRQLAQRVGDPGGGDGTFHAGDRPLGAEAQEMRFDHDEDGVGPAEFPLLPAVVEPGQGLEDPLGGGVGTQDRLDVHPLESRSALRGAQEGAHVAAVFDGERDGGQGRFSAGEPVRPDGEDHQLRGSRVELVVRRRAGRFRGDDVEALGPAPVAVVDRGDAHPVPAGVQVQGDASVDLGSGGIDGDLGGPTAVDQDPEGVDQAPARDPIFGRGLDPDREGRPLHRQRGERRARGLDDLDRGKPVLGHDLLRLPDRQGLGGRRDRVGREGAEVGRLQEPDQGAGLAQLALEMVEREIIGRLIGGVPVAVPAEIPPVSDGRGLVIAPRRPEDPLAIEGGEERHGGRSRAWSCP